MDRFRRIHELHRILSSARYPVPQQRIMDKLECKRATFYRVLGDMRDTLGAPIQYDREAGGYYYDKKDAHLYELPGLWLNPSELYALLAMQKLLQNVQPGLLDVELKPFRERIKQILDAEHLGLGELESRVRVLSMAWRHPGDHFTTCAEATLQRRRMHIQYHGRAKDDVTERDVSPQRLTHYRDNWYLDAWCHQVEGLRCFAVERIRAAKLLEKKARNIAEGQLNKHFASAYGIFAGPAPHTAVLRFTPEAARWVAEEQWHPKQQGRWLDDGGYELKVPYGDSTELVRDILKYGPQVEVIKPAALRQAVNKTLAEAVKNYA